MRTAGLAVMLGATLALAAHGQSLPFAPGERLTYGARVARLGSIGHATMSVDGPVAVRGQPAYHLRFEIDSKVAFIRILNVSESWLVPERMTALRFLKRERHPVSNREERVEIFPGEQRWENASGDAGRTMSEEPLDELSFMYFLRTVTLADGPAMRYDRHYDAARNPTLVRVVGHETLKTPAGTFQTTVVEMQVRDGRYGGDGSIRIHFSDDRRRLPVRIESSIPMAGRAVLTLETYTSGATATVAARP